ncbi:DeoR/GlpR family DNA-binding transcription regulator [Bacillus chungangensis]|uniref:DeoR/GlpR family transcriptional regulator of sugar metabolism n=1 Tax=Bacillus chungangensis TaxID=587633 RepID=A0ABT9WZ17_9BACI|nr:DeoR/GlpR family DNA-binding transcription regulator [Bacillus chungangensis]MDQ0178020.1 DeoR/GlpR family transcriptional regulator of sugar metabolism [Bacillus chungangensis]
MKPFERREKILEYLYKDKRVYVSRLAATFNVTEETIRRDLEKLEKEGIATRNYGGAVLNAHTNEDLPYQTRNTINIEEKINIANKLLPLINDGDTLMTDTSSTVFEALKILCKERENLTIITNSVIVLQEFTNVNHTIISTGGTLRKKSRSLVGTVAHNTVQNYNVDVALFSCKGISLAHGITDSNEPESDLKRLMNQQATKIILLMDSTKFDKIGFIKMFDFDQLDYLITDKKPQEEWISFLEKYGVTVLY